MNAACCDQSGPLGHREDVPHVGMARPARPRVPANTSTSIAACGHAALSDRSKGVARSTSPMRRVTTTSTLAGAAIGGARAPGRDLLTGPVPPPRRGARRRDTPRRGDRSCRRRRIPRRGRAASTTAGSSPRTSGRARARPPARSGRAGAAASRHCVTNKPASSTNPATPNCTIISRISLCGFCVAGAPVPSTRSAYALPKPPVPTPSTGLLADDFQRVLQELEAQADRRRRLGRNAGAPLRELLVGERDPPVQHAVRGGEHDRRERRQHDAGDREPLAFRARPRK